MAEKIKLLKTDKKQREQLDSMAGADDKDVISANRNKRQIERTEAYLSENYDIQYNQVKNEIEIKRKTEAEFKELNENDLWREFQHNKIPFSKNKTIDLLKTSFVQPYDPFTHYFENLKKWDGKTNHILNLASYVHLKDESRAASFYAHFKKHLIRTVRCAIDTNYFNKHALILVHDAQNSGKTTFCRFLCPPALHDYYTENISIDKDGLIAITENFIINLDELATLSKADINALKSIISKVDVKIRRPYDRKATTSPRRCSFVGSTNQIEFLTDSTGNVRWICFEIEKIDWAYSQAIDMNKVWAQAYALYMKGEQHQLTAEEIKANESANENFRIISMEEELLGRTYSPAYRHTPGATFITTTELINQLQKQVDNAVKLTSNSMGRALNKLGFQKASITGASYPIKGYFVKKIDPLEEKPF
jgi:predicted P-loop ATPase